MENAHFFRDKLASGKTLVVATTGGNVATAATVDGKPVIVGLNAYVKK